MYGVKRTAAQKWVASAEFGPTAQFGEASPSACKVDRAVQVTKRRVSKENPEATDAEPPIDAFGDSRWVERPGGLAASGA
jgi:hypothetical protein